MSSLNFGCFLGFHQWGHLGTPQGVHWPEQRRYCKLCGLTQTSIANGRWSTDSGGPPFRILVAFVLVGILALLVVSISYILTLHRPELLATQRICGAATHHKDSSIIDNAPAYLVIKCNRCGYVTSKSFYSLGSFKSEYDGNPNQLTKRVSAEVAQIVRRHFFPTESPFAIKNK